MHVAVTHSVWFVMNPTREDITDLRTAILEAVGLLRSETNRGFDGVYARQDKTNGRVVALEIAAARLDERVESLETIEQVRHRATGEAMHEARLGPERRIGDLTATPITRREVTLVTGAATGSVAVTIAVLKFLRILVP